MKAILISIRPQWCSKIFMGEKTVEVRKTVPNLEPPFKCYVYCTMGDTLRFDGHRTKACKEKFWVGKALNDFSPGRYVGNGHVIGSFICNEIEDYSKWEHDYSSLLRHINISAATNDNYEFLNNYLHGENKGFGWHITEPKLFDKPKKLYKFHGICKKNKQIPDMSCKGCKYAYIIIPGTGKRNIYCDTIIETPPQSWMYCEEEYDD